MCGKSFYQSSYRVREGRPKVFKRLKNSNVDVILNNLASHLCYELSKTTVDSDLQDNLLLMKKSLTSNGGICTEKIYKRKVF